MRGQRLHLCRGPAPTRAPPTPGPAATGWRPPPTPVTDTEAVILFHR